jgi:hypothetical protein
MTDTLGRDFQAMRQLRLDCEQEWREAQTSGLVTPSPDFVNPNSPDDNAYITPSGLEIVKVDDAMEVSAEFEEVNNGRLFDVGYVVEFPADLRDWPTVYRTTYSSAHGEVRTMPRKKYYEVAGILSGLLLDQEMST